jgi:hypothetical protein
MAHPLEHAKSSVKKWGGVIADYEQYHQWLDETKAWVGHSIHRAFRHHSEGIFEMERVFGKSFVNSAGKTVYVRYVGELHVREDCNGYIPTAAEWIKAIQSNKPPLWAIKTIKIEKEHGNITKD